MTDSLDLSKLVFGKSQAQRARMPRGVRYGRLIIAVSATGHALLSLVACVSTVPSYNLAISLFGIYAIGANETVKQFTLLLSLTMILDIIWLASWSWQTSSFTETLVIINLLLKVSERAPSSTFLLRVLCLCVCACCGDIAHHVDQLPSSSSSIGRQLCLANILFGVDGLDHSTR